MLRRWIRRFVLTTGMRLMREGLTRGGGETATGFMSEVARYRFTALTDGEIAAIRSHFDPR